MELEYLERVCGRRREISIDCFPFPVFNWSKFAPWSFNSPECVVWPLWTATGEARSDISGYSEDILEHRASSESRAFVCLVGFDKDTVVPAIKSKGRPC